MKSYAEWDRETRQMKIGSELFLECSFCSTESVKISHLGVCPRLVSAFTRPLVNALAEKIDREIMEGA